VAFWRGGERLRQQNIHVKPLRTERRAEIMCDRGEHMGALSHEMLDRVRMVSNADMAGNCGQGEPGFHGSAQPQGASPF
jgi:hypothetical protein